MKKYTLLQNGSYRNNETGTIGIRPGNWQYRDVAEWLKTNTPDPEYTQEEIDAKNKQEQIDIVNQVFEDTLKNPVECIANGITYNMDGSNEAVLKMRDGIQFAQEIGLNVLNIVDFYNHVNPNIPIADCQEILKQQAQYYYNAYMKRANDRDTILNS